jgi:hypothetical protein
VNVLGASRSMFVGGADQCSSAEPINNYRSRPFS